MFSFICKSSQYLKHGARIPPNHKFYFLHINPLLASSRATLKSIAEASNEPSFTLSYLINTCGLSPEKALSASRYVNLKSPDKPDSVVDFFKNHGFTKTQISTLVENVPVVLLCNPHKTLLPKLEFLQSKGISSTDVAKIVSMAPVILKRSLKNKLIPTFDYFKNLLKSEEKAILSIKRFGSLLLYDLQDNLAANVDILKKAGVPESNIIVFLTYQPRAFMTSSESFKGIVEEVKRMGFNPERLKFILGVHALRAMSKTTWEKKVEAYKKWGWSEEDVMVAFGKHPWCLMKTVDKIEKTMDFFVNEMGWGSSIVHQRPALMSLSLEKRIIPRCLTYQLLLSKGLIKKKISVVCLLEYPERLFLSKFLKRYEEEAPELLKFYQELLELAE